MKRFLPLVVLIGCADVADDTEYGETQSASTPVGGQGTMYNGTMYNGTMYNGTMYNGTMYNGTMYNSATYGGVTSPYNAYIDAGTALVLWTKKGGKWLQRFPDKICTWDGKRQKNLGCVQVDILKNPSPLAGASFPATFTGATGTITGKVYIGTATPQIGVVARDTSTAMHALTGASTAQLIPLGGLDADGGVCTNKSGCRVNSDIWLYTLKLYDPGTAKYVDFCPNGDKATALVGTYDSAGNRSSSTTAFTFACTGGTIEKCVRWGYRPWTSAQKHCDRPANQGGCTPATDTTLYPMADFHQACMRGAAADYCGNGHSFTKNGTIVDIHDYNPTKSAWGFLPSARDNVPTAIGVNGVFMEATFDKLGGIQIDHTRYQDQSAMGTVEAQCLGVFENAGSNNDILCPFGSVGVGCLARTGSAGPGMPQGPTDIVQVDSAPSCAHSEGLVGKFLHARCSRCTNKVANSAGFGYCTDATDPKGWDVNCVNQAKAVCLTTDKMASHNECSEGPALGAYNSGCTIAVCMDPATAHCCAPGGTWDATCTAAANSGKCLFAKKACSFGPSCFSGLCFSQPTTTGTNGF